MCQLIGGCLVGAECVINRQIRVIHMYYTHMHLHTHMRCCCCTALRLRSLPPFCECCSAQHTALSPRVVRQLQHTKLYTTHAVNTSNEHNIRFTANVTMNACASRAVKSLIVALGDVLADSNADGLLVWSFKVAASTTRPLCLERIAHHPLSQNTFDEGWTSSFKCHSPKVL